MRSFSLFLYSVAKKQKMDNQIIRSIKDRGERFSERMNNQTKSDRLKFLIILVGIIAVIIAAYLAWNNFLNPEAKSRREEENRYNQFFQALSDGEDRQREDIYGGKTPQETIDLFVAALEKDDLELASKYFSLTAEGETDPKWLAALQKSKEEDKLPSVINALKRATPAGGWGPYFGFESFNEQREFLISIGLRQNEFSNLWKIESI